MYHKMPAANAAGIFAQKSVLEINLEDVFFLFSLF